MIAFLTRQQFMCVQFLYARCVFYWKCVYSLCSCVCSLINWKRRFIVSLPHKKSALCLSLVDAADADAVAPFKTEVDKVVCVPLRLLLNLHLFLLNVLRSCILWHSMSFLLLFIFVVVVVVAYIGCCCRFCCCCCRSSVCHPLFFRDRDLFIK